jgi:hypothetical protein
MKKFYIENFGEVGEANLRLMSVIRHISGPHWFDLKVGQSCDVLARDGEIRITRTA